MVIKKGTKIEKRDPAVVAILKPYQEDMKRYMGALKEEYQSRVDGIAEQFIDIRKNIKEIKQTLDSHGEKLDSHTEMIGKVMVDVTEIKSDLKQKVDYADFAKLEKRVRLLEVKH